MLKISQAATSCTRSSSTDRSVSGNHTYNAFIGTYTHLERKAASTPWETVEASLLPYLQETTFLSDALSFAWGPLRHNIPSQYTGVPQLKQTDDLEESLVAINQIPQCIYLGEFIFTFKWFLKGNDIGVFHFGQQNSLLPRTLCTWERLEEDFK